MRKQTKWVVVLGAAAVMTFGACMTSFAATGWAKEGGTWYYYDQDEEAVTETWKKASDGKYYYLGEDGAMLTNSWVDGDHRYYVDANGARVTSAWRYMYGFEDDDAEEESWYWFDANGRMVSSKKVTVNGKVYYFDSEGKMLTGWIDTENFEKAESFIQDGTVYATKDGTRLTGWAKLYAPDDEDEEDQYWYYFSSTGAARYSKKSTINGKSYAFNSEGQMLSGWITFEGTNVFEKVESLTGLNYAQVLYAGGANDGAIKKSTWIYSVEPTADAEDADEDRFWYYLGSNGTLTTAANNIADSGQVAGAKLEIGKNNTVATASEAVGLLKINSKTYGFDSEGKMIDGLWRFVSVPATTSYGLSTYYFGKSSDGAMKTGTVTLKNEDTEMSYGYHFSTTKSTLGAGSTGVQSSKLYDEGLLITAEEDTKYAAVIVNGKTYIVNESGKVMTSTSSVYTADNGIKYKNINGEVYYTKNGVTPTANNDKIESGVTGSDVLQYDNTAA